MNWLRKLAQKVMDGGGCCLGAEAGCCDSAPEPSRKDACCPTAGGSCGATSEGPAEAVKEAVRQNYGDLIQSKRGPCCSGSDGTAAQLAGYTAEQLGSVPQDLCETTFACGNPVAFAEIKSGEVVLDIGSGAGLDALLAAQKVGPQGKVIGLDMTPEMIEAARANVKRAGAANVEFRLGDAEHMPVEDRTCDRIISNCVINLAPDKDRVFAEAFRVLKRGGRLCVSDIVTHDLPDEMRGNMAAWTGCVGGALEEAEYLQKIRAAGFVDVTIAARLTYDADSVKALVSGCCSPEGSGETSSDLEPLARQFAGRVSSVRVSAVKPLREE